jgi:hypothetical protein
MPASSEPQSQSNPDVAETDAEAAPMNRAERRAKAKGKVAQQQHLSVNKINPHHTSDGHTQRQYSSRRSGGGGR